MARFVRRRRERNIEYYAQRMADVFSSATEPRLLAEMMTEIPALDILEIKYVPGMFQRQKRTGCCSFLILF